MRKLFWILAALSLLILSVAVKAETFDADGLMAALVGGGTVTMASVPWLVLVSGVQTFKELTLDEYNLLDEAAQGEYFKALNDNRQKQIKALREQIEALSKSGDASAAKITELYDQIHKLDFSRIEHLEKVMKDQGATIAKLLGGNLGQPETAKSQIHNWIKENAEAIKNLRKAKHGEIQFTVKAVGDMTTGAATIETPVPGAMGPMLAPVRPANYRVPFIDSVIGHFETSQFAYTYADHIPKDGGAAFTKEGTLKPQMDFRITASIVTPSKIAVYTVLTEESVQDIVGLQDMATNSMAASHNLARQRELIFGDGIDPNPKGMITYARPFVAGAMAGKVVKPTVMDVINACATGISTTHNFEDENPYIANVTFMNPIDFFVEFITSKTSDGLPLYPTAQMYGSVVINGMLVMPYYKMPADKIFVGDASVYKVSNYQPYSVRIGWINDQMITNKFTMVAESRLHAYVRNVDQIALMYDSLSVIRAAITKP